MKRINYLLVIGTLILLLLIVVCIFPEYFTKVDPYGMQFERLTYENGTFKGATPPIAPCKEFPWGTDPLGRDMKSLIVYGCKTTMLLVLAIVLGRLLIALPLSIMAAYRKRPAAWIIKEFNMVFSAFPIVILGTFFARSNVTEVLFHNKMVPVAIFLTVFGWGKLANMITQKASEVLKQDFIEGEIAIGKNKLEIALQNILPHLVPSLLVQIFLEVAMVLISLAQIGILSTIYVGVGFFNIYGEMNTPMEFDWPSLFIFSYYLFGSDKMWLVLYPALAFSMSIIGFNLFGEGLRLEFDKKDSRVISLMKKLPGALSPAKFVYQVRYFGEYRRPVIQKSVAILLLIGILVFPKPQNVYLLDAQSAFNQLEELQNQADTAVEPASKQAELLSQKLEDFGVLPLGVDYIQEFETERRLILNSDIRIELEHNTLNLKHLENYQFEEFAAMDGTYELEILDIENIRSIVKERAKELEDKVVAVDGVAYFKSGYYVEGDIKPKAFIYILPPDYLTGGTIENHDEGSRNSIWMQVDDPEQLLKANKAKIHISVKTGRKEGINVVGYIPGSDEKLKKEYIILGSPIDYLQSSTADYTTTEIGGNSVALQVAEEIQRYGIKPKRTIVFAFWGGDTDTARGSLDFLKRNLKDMDRTAFYIDLKDLTNMQTDDLIIDTSSVMPKSQEGQAFIKVFKKYAGVNGVKLSYGSIESPYAKDFYDTSRQAMVISSSRKGPIFDKLYADNDQMNQKKFAKAAQMIFNSVVEMASME